MAKLLGNYGEIILEKLFHNIFKNKVVFVTGHTGFQGSWLSLWLKSLGAKVVGYSIDLPTEPSLFETINLKQEIVDIRGDVKDFSHLEDSLLRHKPEFVFHLAAQSLVRLSYERPIETFETNVLGTANLLEAIRSTSSVKVCVVITSDKCYENKEKMVSYKETDPLGGYDPYSASKAAAELVVSSYNRSFFHKKNGSWRSVSVSSVRAGNVIGGGDWARDRIIPDSIRALMSKEPVAIRHPNSVRSWQYVLEPISGMLLLATKMWTQPNKFTGALNFGPDISDGVITVREVVRKILDVWGSGSWIDVSTKSNNSLHEANVLRLSSTKAQKLLGWRAAYSLEDSIVKVVDWYQSFIKKQTEMKAFTLKQIENYVTKAKQLSIPWAKGL